MSTLMDHVHRSIPEPLPVPRCPLDMSREEILSTDINATLRLIVDLATRAQGALADEHEGDFTASVLGMYAAARRLRRLTEVW
jgi:hypothetical protein